MLPIDLRLDTVKKVNAEIEEILRVRDEEMVKCASNCQARLIEEQAAGTLGDLVSYRLRRFGK